MVLGEAVLSAFLQVLFDRLAARELLDFFRSRDFDEFLLEKLMVKLLSISAVLNDAEEKQVTNPIVKKWVAKLKDTVYQAEDLLDLISTEALRCKAEKDSRPITRQVWNYISTSFFQFDRNIESKIEGVIHKLEYIASQTDALGLKEVTGAKQSKGYLPTTSLVDESYVFGRENDREEIIKLLLSSDDVTSNNNISVITIVGMGGIGKTTLAQLAYNDCRVKEQFVLRAWVCVSQQYDITKVTKMILECVTSLTFETEDLNRLQVELKMHLTGKTFLIILDDVWIENYDQWHVLQQPFKGGNRASKIVVTTRNANIALMMRTVPSYYLNLLSFDDCWSLFSKHAFEDENPGEHLNLEVIGRAVADKCKGLPLAAKSLGGLLRRKLCTQEWENALSREIWDVPTDSCEILPVLRLSYHHLPAHLKRCFAYCSIFPKGYIFEKGKLVLLWMAEGLLHQPRRQKTIEEVGNEYFDELVARSLFQQLNGHKTHFVMHDFINDLAKSVAGEFCFQIEQDHGEQCTFQHVRHFSYIQSKYDCFKRFEVFSSFKYLRTFLPVNLSPDDVICYISDRFVNDLLPEWTYLRVLSLSHYKITSLSDSISNLIYMRYLDLSHTAIRRLPESVTNLYNLQTLLLSYCYLIELPIDFWKLMNLRHLDIHGSKLSKMPLNMGRLKELQRLTDFVVGESGGSRISELKELSHLRGALSLSKLQNVVYAIDALQADLKGKRYLDELILEWDGNNYNHPGNDIDVLDKLQPHRNVKMLSVKWYRGSKFPNWMGDPSYAALSFLTLSNCKNCRALPPLGQLPLLEVLVIKGMSGITRVGNEFYRTRFSSAKPFQSLKTLRFEEMMEWEEWISAIHDRSREFPCLEELCLLKCPKLASPFPKVTSLQKLELEECDHMLLVGISHFASLVSLKVISGLVSLPSGFFQQQKVLKKLMIAHCDELLSLSDQVGFNSLSMLETLEISFCQNLTTLPTGLHTLASIKKLRIDGCPNLVTFPKMGLPPMLTHLIVEECESLQSLPIVTMHYSSSTAGPSSSSLSSLVANLPATLKEVRIMNCKKLGLFPEGMILNNVALECLNLFGCDSLKSFAIHFPNVVHVDISGCINLESLPEELHNLTSLMSFTIMSCPLLQSFPNGGLPTSNLKSLEINCCDNLKSLPPEMHTIQSLQRLHISHCPQIVSFPDNGLPSNLRSLCIINCCKLMPKIEWDLHKLSSLRHFKIARFPDFELFSDDWLLPSSLSSLHIASFQDLTSLPKALYYLTSLENLEIEGCSKLLSLPEGGLPTSLTCLHIMNCPILTDRCQRDIGEDWQKIASIPCITVNYKIIS